MTQREAKVGVRVRSLRDFSGVRKGTEGIIDEDYGAGVMVAWDLPAHPLPRNYFRYDGKPAIQTGILRDGFDKETELEFLEPVPYWELENRIAMEGLDTFNRAFKKHFGV
jgi:hypothetical protein